MRTHKGRDLRGDGTVPFPPAFPQECDGSNHPMSLGDDDKVISGVPTNGTGEPAIVFPAVSAGGWRLRVEGGQHLVEDIILVM